MSGPCHGKRRRSAEVSSRRDVDSTGRLVDGDPRTVERDDPECRDSLRVHPATDHPFHVLVAQDDTDRTEGPTAIGRSGHRDPALGDTEAERWRARGRRVGQHAACVERAVRPTCLDRIPNAVDGRREAGRRRLAVGHQVRVRPLRIAARVEGLVGGPGLSAVVADLKTVIHGRHSCCGGVVGVSVADGCVADDEVGGIARIHGQFRLSASDGLVHHVDFHLPRRRDAAGRADGRGEKCRGAHQAREKLRSTPTVTSSHERRPPACSTTSNGEPRDGNRSNQTVTRATMRARACGARSRRLLCASPLHIEEVR